MRAGRTGLKAFDGTRGEPVRAEHDDVSGHLRLLSADRPIEWQGAAPSGKARREKAAQTIPYKTIAELPLSLSKASRMESARSREAVAQKTSAQKTSKTQTATLNQPRDVGDRDRMNPPCCAIA